MSSNIGQNADRSISNFQIFVQSVINENCHNSIPSNDIAMKLGPVTKPDIRNTAHVKKQLRMTSCRRIVRHCQSSNEEPVWSNLEGGFWTHGL